ncbi:MAG TPA: tryptophan synthase subunit alpha [Burkholderiales bacterium]|nr:tryptophan synthase subunit alpha [Burkholderiales bacterium]
MSRIQQTFAAIQARKKKALIPFVTAGDPDLSTTVPIMHALAGAGADIIELGVPFSDPMADGPTIQRSSERALKHGTSLRHVMDMVKEFRTQDTKTPVVLMGYANPIEAMGHAAFAKAAQAAGVDGVLVVDYPPEEGSDLVDLLKAHGIDSIFLLSPTSQDSRMERVGRMATGYIYYVSLKGVTGAANLDLQDVAAKIPQIRSHIKLPIGVGFGIRDAETAKAIASVSDAVVIGSRLVQEIENSASDKLLGNLSALVGGIRRAMDGA